MRCAVAGLVLMSSHCARPSVAAPERNWQSERVERQASRAQLALAALSSAPCRDALSLEWTFRAASPFSGPPAISVAGDLVLLRTFEGYVHALSDSGKFLWSYTTKGSLDVPPVVTIGGSSWLDSTGNLFGISSSGATLRQVANPLRRADGFARGWPFAVVLRGRRLYGLTKDLKQSWTEVYPSEFVSDLVPMARRYSQGILANGTLVTIQSPGRQWQLPLTRGRPVLSAQLRSSGTGSLAVLEMAAGSPGGAPVAEAVFVAKKAVQWRAPNAYAGALGPSIAVLVEETQVRWVKRQDGSELSAINVGGIAATPPLLLPDGSVLIAIRGEQVVAIHRQRGVIGTCHLEPGRAYAPLLFDDGPTSRAIVATGGGHALAFSVFLDDAATLPALHEGRLE